MRINGKIVGREDVDEKIARMHYENEILKQRLMSENLEFRIVAEKNDGTPIHSSEIDRI